jgi:nitrite reductase/ring-hydroxylating ferredoxin subunit
LPTFTDGQGILVANAGGTFCAIANSCPHKGGALSRGAIADGMVTCPKHRARFDPRSGRDVGDATVLFKNVPVNDVQVFPVTIDGTDVLVEIV